VGQNPFKNAKNRGKTPQNGQNGTKSLFLCDLRQTKQKMGQSSPKWPKIRKKPQKIVIFVPLSPPTRF
jgi:hypothetical protein